MQELTTFLKESGLEHLKDNLMGQGINLELLLLCNDQELTLFTPKPVDKIKLRIALDKLRSSRFEVTEPTELTDSEFVALPRRETTTICMDSSTTSPYSIHEQNLTSTPHKNTTQSASSVFLLNIDDSFNSSIQGLTSTHPQTAAKSTPQLAAIAGPSGTLVFADSSDLKDFNDEDLQCLESLDLSKLGNETGNSLRQLLSSITFGRILLQKAEKGEKLNSKDRGIIAKLVVEAELRNLNTVTDTIRKDVWQRWADEVVYLFKGEDKEVYYVPYHIVGGKVIQASGMFHNRLITHRRSLSTNIKKRKASTSSESSGVSSCDSKRLRPLPDSYVEQPLPDDTIDSHDWLKGASTPEDLVAVKWIATFEIRNNILANGITNKDYIESYPAHGRKKKTDGTSPKRIGSVQMAAENKGVRDLRVAIPNIILHNFDPSQLIFGIIKINN